MKTIIVSIYLPDGTGVGGAKEVNIVGDIADFASRMLGLHEVEIMIEKSDESGIIDVTEYSRPAAEYFDDNGRVNIYLLEI